MANGTFRLLERFHQTFLGHPYIHRDSSIGSRTVETRSVARSRDTFAPIGPYLVTADEVPDPHRLQVRLWVNGVLKQNFNTSDMAHRIPRCLEWVTSIHTMEPGDLLATGTNHRGLSAFQNDDLIELETEGLGRLRVHVRDDLKRTWAREARLERQERTLEDPRLS
jgi:2-keto-4-pentenoate hydratase/2-oxohepta-3-ene-1,7-dioic acid hydratase in catechol pathway